MLLQFTVENYLSFDEEVTFSMLTGKDKDHPRHLIEGKPTLVRGAAIYGANGAGKSNLLAAMEFSRRLIVRGVRPDADIGNRPFALRGDASRPTKFGWIFRHMGKVWNYEIALLGNHIAFESLVARDEKGGRESLFFKRETDEGGVVKADFGAQLRGKKNSEDEQFLRFVARGCRPEQPFFAEILEHNVNWIEPLSDWFRNVLCIITPKTGWGGKRLSFGASSFGKHDQAFEPVLVNDAKFTTFLSEFLRYADIGIERVEFEKQPFRAEEHPEIASEFGFRTEIILQPRQQGQAYFALFPEDFKMPTMVLSDTEGVWILTPKAVHRDENGQERRFPFEWESAGTRRLLHLVPWLFRVFCKPTVLLIDELDQHLHTLLAREFVRLCLEDKRAAQSQLIFTTHDTNLLDSWLLRRDEIWFVDKNERGASSLYSMAQYKTRKDLNFEKAYLSGLFEGKPYFQFSPTIQGLDIPADVRAPSEAQLQGQIAQLREVAEVE